MLDLETQRHSGPVNRVGRGVGHARQQPDLDRPPGWNTPGPHLQERIDEEAVQLLEVGVGQVPLDVDEVRDGDPTEACEPECGSGSRDLADPRIRID